MQVSRLKEILSQFNDDENITFYFMKNDTLTNCQMHDIELYDPEMGIEFTIQDTSEVMEELVND
mgnify:CR=1 FL=1